MALLNTLMDVQTEFRPVLLSGEKNNTGTPGLLRLKLGTPYR